jgi:hypothetical protein
VLSRPSRLRQHDAASGREQGVTLLLLDESAKVPDDLYCTVRPMTRVARGRIIGLSTPFGQRGWLFHEWHNTADWRRFTVTRQGERDGR